MNKIPIIEARQTGYGLLIERDAGYINADMNMDLIKNLKENKHYLQENENNSQEIQCILQKYGVLNKNGRIYPERILKKQVDEYMHLVKDGSSISEADHPETSVISLHNISHRINDMWWGEGDKKNILFGKIELYLSPQYINRGEVSSMIGDKIMEYLKRGTKLGISSRGVGSVKSEDGKHIVQPDFELIGFDLVASPSTPGAFLFTKKPGIQKEEKEIIKSVFDEKLQKNLEIFLK